ncbi:MAG: YggW family oxidoreductase [Oceanospirillaceae bacterium]|jgi:oxygen-independent coproporphyrinogen-3 oxidase|nr:YggW family oxidoreductase [Oceanospirillaceae bacterium]
MTLPPLSLYVHIPWCVRKCPYCDFNSHAQRDTELPEQAYVKALLDDLDAERALSGDRPLQTIFFGGGTPSLFSAAAIGDLLDGVAARFSLAPELEVTLEANPGTFEQARFADYRRAGVNRLSIGVQSFNDNALTALGRIHQGREARTAAESARELFPRLNLDLMHGLPGQTPAQAMEDLAIAIGLEADHLSWYQLTIEPNTEFHSRPPQLPLDEALWAIQEQGQAQLREAGFHQYEVSAYAKPGCQARHNLNYWRFGDYIGIGAGAHGKLTQSDKNGITIRRRHKIRQPAAYMDPGRRLAGDQPVSDDELPFEFMLNALRLHDGFDLTLFFKRTGLELAEIQPTLIEAERRQLLTLTGERVRPTLSGQLFLNDLLAMFLE